MTAENRHATEILMTAFERLAEQAQGKGWPLALIVDAAFRAGASLSMAHRGLPETAAQCRNLADELDRLGALLAQKDHAA